MSILEATGVAAEAGLRAGQAIVMVEGAEVQTGEEIRLLFRELPTDQPVHITVRSAEPTAHKSSGRSLGDQLASQSRVRDGAFRPRSTAGQDSATTWDLVCLALSLMRLNRALSNCTLLSTAATATATATAT
jgi:membrane-associated protease RseP (regulator of RpoE activity)